MDSIRKGDGSGDTRGYRQDGCHWDGKEERQDRGGDPAGEIQGESSGNQAPAARFFTIARQLPLELQMVLCYRVVGSAKEIIPGKDSEVAFKSLAKSLFWSSVFTN